MGYGCPWGSSLILGKAVKTIKLQLKVLNLCPPSYLPKPSSGPDCSLLLGPFMGLMFDTQSLPLDINGTQVKSVESHKFLGLNIKLTLGLDHEHHSYGEKCPVLALFHHSAQRGRTELHPMAPAYRGVIKSILNTVITVCYGKKKTHRHRRRVSRE